MTVLAKASRNLTDRPSIFLLILFIRFLYLSSFRFSFSFPDYLHTIFPSISSCFCSVSGCLFSFSSYTYIFFLYYYYCYYYCYLLNSIIHEIGLVHFQSGQYCTCVFCRLYRRKSLLLETSRAKFWRFYFLNVFQPQKLARTPLRRTMAWSTQQNSPHSCFISYTPFIKTSHYKYAWGC
jgi:hypothetical protein